MPSMRMPRPSLKCSSHEDVREGCRHGVRAKRSRAGAISFELMANGGRLSNKIRVVARSVVIASRLHRDLVGAECSIELILTACDAEFGASIRGSVRNRFLGGSKQESILVLQYHRPGATRSSSVNRFSLGEHESIVGFCGSGYRI